MCNTVTWKLSNLQFSKLKTAVKHNEGTTLKLGTKNFNKTDLPHELFLPQRQHKLRNNIKNNISTNIKLSKAHKKNNNVRRCFRVNFDEVVTQIN